MLFFGIFKKDFRYEFVAQNVAAIYYVIKNDKWGEILTKEQIQFATALIDSSSYISNDRILIDTIAKSIRYVNIGMICVGDFYTKMHSLLDFSEEDFVTNLAMQVEAMLFCSSPKGYKYLDNNFLYEMEEIIRKKPLISSSVNKVLKAGYKSKAVKRTYSSIKQHLNDLNFQSIVLSYDEYTQEENTYGK